MSIDSEATLEGLKRCGRVVAETLAAMRVAIRVGLTTRELDDVARSVMRKHGARSAPQLTYNFPGWTCISVNDEVVHGVPGARKLQPADVVKIDVTAELGGFVADAAETVLVPPVSPAAAALAACARSAFARGLAAISPGTRLRDVGRVIQREVEGRGFAVVRELSGHGVGRTIHEPPDVLNYFHPLHTGNFEDGMVVALEPIIAASDTRVQEDADGWTIRTRNRALAAHHEHTIVVAHGGALVITAPAA